MNKALIKLQLAIELLKLELRRALLKHMGVDQMLKRAFEEGWNMHSETDEHLCEERHVYVNMLDTQIKNTRTWRSVEEAWANSDSEEEV